MTRTTANSDFPAALMRWRKIRRLSQLELALTADVSQRHISWLETGRSEPSREMVLRLSDAMLIPLRNRNELLTAAGFARYYKENELSEPVMESVLDVLHIILDNHQPYPAMVIDRFWNIKIQNDAAQMLFSISGDSDELWQGIGSGDKKNLALLSIHPNGLRQYIRNFGQIIGPFLRRLQREANESSDAELMAQFSRFQELLTDIDLAMILDKQNSDLIPIIPLEIEVQGTLLKLFSVVSSFGTVQDITAEELRIETLFPADEQTKQFFKHG